MQNHPADQEPRRVLGSFFAPKSQNTPTWEQRKFSDITFPAGEKNRDNLPLESYSITNEHGFIPQDEKFENGGTMREADKRMYYIVSPNSFAYNPARINVGSIGYQNTGKDVIVSSLYEVFKTSDDVDDRLLWHWFKSPDFQKLIMQLQEGGVRLYFYYDKLCMGQVPLPSLEEQRKIGKLFDTLDHLITLHQRKCIFFTGRAGRLISTVNKKRITSSWEQRKLSEMCGTFEYGLNAAAKEFDGKNKYIRITDIDDASREFLLSDLSSPDICLDGMSKYLLSSGDIVFARTGASVGKTYIYRENDGIVYFAGFLIRAKVNQDNDAEFVFQSTLSPSYEKYIRITSQRSGQPGVNAQEYGEYDLFAPSKEEQQRIGHFLRGIDNLITLHQRKFEKLTNVKKSMLEKMFPQNGSSYPEIRFKGFTDPWEQRKVGDLLIERNQQAPMSDEYPLMAFIANEGVAPKGERYDRSALVTDTVNKLYKKTEKGDFIYSSNNLETGSIGLNKYGKACISPVYSIFEPTGIADSDFLGRRLVRKDFINAMVKWRQGVIYGQWRIHESDFLKIEITVPSVEEQRKIGAYLDQLDNLITLHQRELEKLQNIKKSMLEKMFV